MPKPSRAKSGKGKPKLKPKPRGLGKNPAFMPLADAAKVLTAAGAVGATPDAIKADIAAGAPANDDGTINIVNYGAWLFTKAVNNGR